MFRVGQRVRYIGGPDNAGLNVDDEYRFLIGAQGVIVRARVNDEGWEFLVDFPACYSMPAPDDYIQVPTQYYCDGCELRPLADPKEEAKRQVRELLDNALKAAEKSKQVVNSRDSICAPDKVYFEHERHV